jgi:AcrR family transcriptional regulator
MASPAPRSAVRRRPRDRKEQLVRQAARLFWERGYDQVGMVDIAGAVGVGASALYRHFPGKAALLASVLATAIERLEVSVDGATELGGQLLAVTEAMLDHREYPALWERARAQLPPGDYERLRARRDGVTARLAESIRGEVARDQVWDPARARLRARVLLAVLESPSWHRVELERDEFAGLLCTAASATLSVELSIPGRDAERGERTEPRLPVSRREALLAAASRLFAERGYSAVSLDDVGAAIGIAGPSIYNHFASKADLLLSTLNRGNEALWFALHQALASANDPSDVLGRLLDSYTAIIFGSSQAIAVLVGQVGGLPAEQRSRFRRVQQEYVAEWVALLRSARPELAEAPARVLVHAALGLVNALAGGPDVRRALSDQLGPLGRAVLGIAERSESSLV